MPVPELHFVNGHSLAGPFDENLQQAVFALGCFWGAERIFWETPGVYSTAVGYAGGITPNPDYREVCSGLTGHTEVVRIVFDPERVSYAELLRVFWEAHDPTQGMRQGNDVGTQYRSAIFTHSERQSEIAHEVRAVIDDDGPWDGPIVTEIQPLETFYPAEEYHDAYFRRNGQQPYCAAVIAPKVAKFRQRFAHRLNPGRA